MPGSNGHLEVDESDSDVLDHRTADHRSRASFLPNGGPGHQLHLFKPSSTSTRINHQQQPHYYQQRHPPRTSCGLHPQPQQPTQRRSRRFSSIGANTTLEDDVRISAFFNHSTLTVKFCQVFEDDVKDVPDIGTGSKLMKPLLIGFPVQDDNVGK